MKSINEIQDELIRLGEAIGASKEALLIGDPISDPVVDVEIRGNKYHYVVVERGVETSRMATQSTSELMYYFIESATFSMASSYAARNKKKGETFRQVLFRKQLELLKAIRPEWAAVRQREIDDILKKESA